MNKLVMYILVREAVPVGNAIVAVAHASLAAYLRFEDSPDVAEWLSGPFYKTVCMVNDREYAQAKECPDHVVITESTLGGAEVALAFRPRAEWPTAFKYFRLYKTMPVGY